MMLHGLCGGFKCMKAEDGDSHLSERTPELRCCAKYTTAMCFSNGSRLAWIWIVYTVN